MVSSRFQLRQVRTLDSRWPLWPCKANASQQCHLPLAGIWSTISSILEVTSAIHAFDALRESDTDDSEHPCSDGEVALEIDP
jgi:hypothetical protein